MSNNKSWMSEAYSEMRKADTIEPTEEQKEAVRTWCTRELATTYGWHPIAQFLAEREAKLRAVCTVQALQMARSVEDETAAEIDTLREENRILRAQWLARNEENQAELAECEDTEEGDNELAEREAKLREEVYAQAWNLGGISVLATSRTMQDYDQTMARPALNEVAALLKDYDTLRARVAELEDVNVTLRTLEGRALDQCVVLRAELDTLRVDLARANDERVRANGYLLAAQKSEMAMKSQLADATARVAELEAREKVRDLAAEVDTGEPVDVLLMRTLSARVAELEAKIADAVFSCPGCGRHDFGFFASQIKAACGPCRTRAEAAEAREAQHLADIKAAASRMYCREFEVMCSNNCPPKCHCVDCRIYERLAHYDDAKADAPVRDFSVRRAEADAVWARIERVVDAKADAPASDADIEARVLAGAFARRRKASTEGRCAMSEPVIKARLWCQQCGLVGRSHTIGRTHAFRIRHVVREGYTRDDLVRVAIEMAKACGHADEKARDRARRNVDRLTKGDV